MTKFQSSGAKCKVQVRLRMRLRVHVRVEVAPALSCPDGKEWRKGIAGVKGRCPRKLQLQELLPFPCGQAPFGSSPSSSAWGAPEAPDACSVR